MKLIFTYFRTHIISVFCLQNNQMAVTDNVTERNNSGLLSRFLYRLHVTKIAGFWYLYTLLFLSM